MPAPSLSVSPLPLATLARALRQFLDAYPSMVPGDPTFAQLTRRAFHLAYLLVGHCAGGRNFDHLLGRRFEFYVFAAAWLASVLTAETPVALGEVLPVAQAARHEL